MQVLLEALDLPEALDLLETHSPILKGLTLNLAPVAALRAVQDVQQTKDQVISIKALILVGIENTLGVVVVIVVILPEGSLTRTNQNNRIKTTKETKHNLFIYRYNSLCFGTQMLKNS